MLQINFKPSNPGTETVPKYRSIIRKDGSVCLVEDGVRYLQDEIQSYEEECNVNNIMRRYQAGDVNALGSMQGVFADIFDIPETRQAVIQKVMDAQQTFADLPADIRQRYNGSWEQFYLSGPKDIYEAYGVSPESISIVQEPAVESKE